MSVVASLQIVLHILILIIPLASGSETPPPQQCPPNNYNGIGQIVSPGWPNAYFNNMMCNYYIEALDGHIISLRFTSFNTEACCDYVYLYDGPDETSPLIRRLSGQEFIGTDWKSTGRYLTVRFTSDNFIVDQGYIANYTQERFVDPCSNFTCQNGGTCKVDGSTAQCACPGCFTGTYCQDLVPDPCQPFINACMNGGSCIYDHTTCTNPRCQCAAGYTGAFCGQPISSTTTTP